MQSRSRRALLATVAGLSVAGCTAREKWDFAGTTGDDHANADSQPNGRLETDLEETWSVDVGRGPWTSPVVADGVAYVGNRDGLRGLSVDEGERVGFGFDGPVSGTPVVDADGILVPVYRAESGTGALYALDASGAPDWETELPGGRPFSPTTAAGAVAIRTEGSTCLLSRRTGEVRWTESVPPYRRPNRNRFVDLSPAMADGRVFVPGTDGLRCLERDGGYPLWHRETARVGASPAVADGTLYCAVGADGVEALSTDSGRVRWTVAASGCWTSPAVGDDRLYVTADFDLLAIDRMEGDVRWRLEEYAEHGLRGDSYTDPVLVGDAVVSGSIGRTISVVPATGGRPSARVDGDGTTVSHAVTDDGVFALDGRTLRAFR